LAIKQQNIGQKQSFVSRSDGKYVSFLILCFYLEILLFVLAIYFEMGSNHMPKKERILDFIRDVRARYRLGVDPNKDWQILLSFFLLLTLVVVTSGVYRFIRVQNGSVFSDSAPAAAATLEVFDNKTLEHALDLFEIKKKNFADRLRSETTLIDPSR